MMANPIIFKKPCPLLLQTYDMDNPEDTNRWVFCEQNVVIEGKKYRQTGWLRCWIDGISPVETMTVRKHECTN